MTDIPLEPARMTTIWSWVVVAFAGWLLGRLLTASVGRLVDPPRDRDHRLHRVIETVTVIVAVALWWWEIQHLGQQPAGMGFMPGMTWRYAAHLVLFVLLAAASWVDARHRVIPDDITLPGALAGLAWSCLEPASLLPIVHEVPRPFAVPLRVPDVLTAWGGLAAGEIPPLLAGWPQPAGLLVGTAIFVTWWWTCTAPFREPWPVRPRGLATLLGEPRNVVLVAGLAGVAAAWRAGGVHWSGLATSLVGMAVAGGIIWLTRLGASWAVGREAMGLGDVTLMAMAGAWLGWQACVLACFFGVFIGLVHGGWQMLRHREPELPFGPSLCLATAAVVVFWRPSWERFGDLLAEPLDMAVVIAAVILLTAAGLMGWRRVRAGLFG